MMKRFLLLFACLLFAPLVVNGQMILDSFDELADTTILSTYEGDVPAQYLNLSIETTNVHSGTGALRVEWQNARTGEWGGWINIGHTHPDSLGVFDFSPYTEFSMWYYVEVPSSTPNEVDFRIMLNDVGPANNFEEGGQENWISQHYILDSEPGWNQLIIPLVEGEGNTPSDGFGNPNWSGTPNNGELDLDKIRSWVIEWSQNIGLEIGDSVSGVILFDEAQLQGVAPVNLVLFNGKAVPSEVSMFVGWSGAAEVTNEDAYTPGTNSVKWTTGSGWDGVNFQLASPKNLQLNWDTDSVQFKIKTDAGIGNLLVVFHDVDEDGADKEDYAFQAAYTLAEADMKFDGTWKVVKLKLSEFNNNNGCWDADLGATVYGLFDSSRVQQFTIGGTGQTFEGMTVYLDDIWTGNPEFDWIPPVACTGIDGVPSAYYNLVIWQDVPDEAAETYNIYASTEPITDIKAPGIEIIATGVVENTQTVVHYLKYPLVDKDVTYYYAVECVDASGNVGPFGVSGAITNTAKGVPTISLNPPDNFAADGDFSEWEASGIMPWVLKPETDNVATGTVTDSIDLKATVYLAMDDDNLYVAIDVIDDVFSYSATEGDWWNWDAFEFYLGLYDQRGPMHSSIMRGEEPDYKLVFQEDRFFHEYKNGGTTDPMYTPGTENYYFEQFSGADYVCEAKVPLDSIAFGDDTRFHPVRGMRIPFDLYFHDNDGTTAGDWEGNLAYSKNNTDLAWQTVEEWTYTWLGDTTATDIVMDDDYGNTVMRSYTLSQNYPNPFNPTTTINYSLANAGLVKIDIYNTLGQRVKSLVNEHKPGGSFTIEINAEDLTSGIYFYRIQAGDFAKTMKMILMK